MFTAQIDDCSDTQLVQRLHAVTMRLRATEEMIVDFPRVVDTVDLNFFREGRSFFRDGWCVAFRSGELGRESEENCARREKRKLFHRELHAKSLEKNFAAEHRNIPETAPLDIDAQRKSYPDFAIFS